MGRGQNCMVTLGFNRLVKLDRLVLELGLYSFTIIHPDFCNQGN